MLNNRTTNTYSPASIKLFGWAPSIFSKLNLDSFPSFFFSYCFYFKKQLFHRFHVVGQFNACKIFFLLGNHSKSVSLSMVSVLIELCIFKKIKILRLIPVTECFSEITFQQERQIACLAWIMKYFLTWKR